MRPCGSKQQLEVRRRTAVALRKRGLTMREVAQEVGSVPSSVVRWEQAFDRNGDHGLDPIPQAGGKSRLTLGEKRRLVKYLRKSPRHFGWTTELWTLARVGELINRKFGVRYHISHVHRLLRMMNFTAQKPARLARERDDAAIADFRETRWPEIKKARREQRTIVLLDESGFMLQPLVRRTWAPRGETPVHRSWDRHDRLSVISAIAVSPERRRLRLHFEIHGDNIRAPQAIRFIRRLRRKLGGRKLLVVWDKLNVHRSAAKKLARGDGIRIEWLPSYAPDLNPVEAVWNHTKYVELANFIPADAIELAAQVATSLHLLRSEHNLLEAYFRHAGLHLTRPPRRSVVR